MGRCHNCGEKLTGGEEHCSFCRLALTPRAAAASRRERAARRRRRFLPAVFILLSILALGAAAASFHFSLPGGLTGLFSRAAEDRLSPEALLASLTGLVTNPAGTPIEGARVELWVNNERIAAGESGPGGCFFIEEIPAGGGYTVIVFGYDGFIVQPDHVKQGFQDAAVGDVTLEATVDNRLDFVLDTFREGAISGTVTCAESGAILQGVEIKFELYSYQRSFLEASLPDGFSGFGRRFAVKTDQNGAFIFTGIPAGPDYSIHNFTVNGNHKLPGYEVVYVEGITLEADQPVFLDLQLEKGVQSSREIKFQP